MLGFSPVGGAPAGSAGGTTPPPAPPVNTPHRFWQLYFDTSNSGNISASHIEFRATEGGPNICTGGVGTASSTYSGFDPNAVWAGTNAWASNGGAPQWIQYDLGVGNEAVVVEIAYTVRTDGYPEQSPATGRLRWSDDGTSFYDASTEITWEPWSTGQTQITEITAAPPPPALATSRVAEYVLTGPSADLFASRLAEYAVTGPNADLFTSRIAQYIVTGPPVAPTGTLSQAMLGTF